MTRRIPRRLTAALALTALLAAGCGSGGDETTTGASAGGSSSTAASGKAVRFAACMREHGVREFPDPDASGELTIDAVVNGTSIDADGPAWRQAIAACRELQPAGFTGKKRSDGQQEAALRFAACMREQGVADFPDPEPGQPLVDTNRIPSSNRPGGMDRLNAAMQTCRTDAEAATGQR